MQRILDPEGAHLAALRRLADFAGKTVLELGCGDGRLTVGIAPDAARVLAFDPDAEAVERARRALPAADRDRGRIPCGVRHGGRRRAGILRPRALLLVSLMSSARGRRARPGP